MLYYNNIVEPQYIKVQQMPDLILNKQTKKYMFLELEVVPLHLLTLFEASISAQFLLPTFEQICGGITDCITKELQLPTFAISSLRQLGLFLPLSLQLIFSLSRDLIQSENKICLPPKALKLFWVIFFFHL